MASASIATFPTNSMSSPKTSNHNPSTDTVAGAAQSESKSQGSNQTGAPKAVKQEGGEDDKTSTAPLAPPPKPSQSHSTQQGGNDYFGGAHQSAHFSREPNPFEQQFGEPSSETPGPFPGLPSVQSLASPAPVGQNGTPGWQNSLRSGPLSPAMLTGPQNTNGGDYFDSSFRQSYPTPNESSMRSTGLTPGGPSMFPAPSPNSQAIFNQIGSAGATPGTIEFQRTAMEAAARQKRESGPSNLQQSQNMQGINKQDYQPAQQQQSLAQNPYNNNSNTSEHDAVNSLYMLANNGQRNPNQFSMPNSQTINTNAQQNQNRGGNQSQDTSPTYQRGQQASMGNMSASTGGNMSENGGYDSEGSLDAKPSGRGRSRKQGNKGNTTSNGGRRKADDTPVKGSAAKKQKANNGQSMDMGMPNFDDDDEDDIKHESQMPDVGRDGKKLTDEEKRKNFLERNRVAALKCRQRKKQWLANLQAKVEIFTTENDALTTQCAQLREENQNLKALLYQHKDCPVSHQQGLGGSRMAQVLGAEFESGPQAAGPGYGQMGMQGQQSQPGMMGQGMHG